MLSSVCDAPGKGRAVKKLWRPAALLCLTWVLLVALALYNSCPSCNSELVWLSLYPSAPASSSSSLILAPLSSRPAPKPIFFPEPQHNFSDYELGGDDADSAAAPSENPHTLEVLDSEDSGGAIRADNKVQNASHSGDFYTQPNRHARVPDGSGGGSDQSPRVLRTQELPSSSAGQRGIAKRMPMPDADLHAPVYYNLSMFIKSYELMEKTFKIYVYREGTRPLVHAGPTVGIYASEGRFISQLQSSKRFTTSDPNKAHLFFMPYSVTNMVRKIYVPDSHNIHPLTRFITSYVDLIASKYPYWNRSHGADHFFVSCHDWGPATARETADLRRNGIKVVCNADEKEEFVVGKDVSLPETSLRAAKPPTRLGGPPTRKRPYLAFFAGQMHGRVRPILLRHWKDKDPDMRIYERIPAAIAKKTSYLRHMRMSKFCICPMGYEVNSPRIVEAIYYDCVPVIIADNFVLPFSDILNWQAFSVSVAERDVPRLKQILVSIPDTKYTAMQANLKHVRQHFVWHYKLPVKYDVFHMILHSLWLRRRSAALSVNTSQ